MNFDPQSDRQFNNPDSFAMAFDEAWQKLSKLEESRNLDEEKKIKMVLEKIKGHPFLEGNHNKAKEIAVFRIRLLGLS